MKTFTQTITLMQNKARGCSGVGVLRQCTEEHKIQTWKSSLKAY